MEGKLFGDKLRYILTTKNITAKELSFSSGISQSHLSKLINNQLQPRFDKIESIAKVLEVSPGIFFNNEKSDSAFGKPLNLNSAVIETDFMLADIYLSEDKKVFGFYLRYLKDYEAMLNKYDEIIKSDYQFMAYISKGEITLKLPNGKTENYLPGDILRKEKNNNEIIYSVKAGTFLTAVFMGDNMNSIWDYYTKNKGLVITERVIK
ncbi:MAG: helix-turn-helix transcriptional regulator [Ignavibacteriae bacterium]|jgi:transcriptional regulator with XRE-family HTH domain|nr:XRE family transcriptional regulator [Ignavibacteriota bacterium]NOG99646.1 helix-turn-helix transcriptional regulator [Ignavibacteriota bacterium]